MNAYQLAVPLFVAIALIGCSKGGGGENAAANAAAPAAAENAAPAANTAAPAENAPAAGNAAVPSGAAENAAAPAENTGAAAGAPGAENSAAAGGATATAADGQQVYQTTCSACHGTGVMGAPKFGNKADWGPRIAKGKATLDDHALHGFKQMPAKGGNPSLTDAQVKAAVDYMVAQAGK